MLPGACVWMPSGWMYTHDNDSKRTSAIMMSPVRKLRDGRRIRLPGWFSLNNVRPLRLSPLSPDLNPIEHLFAFVKQKLRGKRFENKDELWLTIMEIWADIPQDILTKLVDSMPKRINAVILSRGGPTKY